jgi:hypothetical protein
MAPAQREREELAEELPLWRLAESEPEVWVPDLSSEPEAAREVVKSEGSIQEKGVSRHWPEPR